MIYLQNQEIKLRALEPKDLESLYQWENNTNEWHTGSTVEPYSRYILETYIEQASKNLFEGKQLRLIIERRSDSKAIGAIDLFDYDSIHNRAGVGILIESAEQGKGYGNQSLELLLIMLLITCTCNNSMHILEYRTLQVNTYLPNASLNL